ncbi:MAG: hypothetical protein KBC21_00780 [Candidatus Pacebacteria bacterium]|nr:hypothetical protein [Candidatus Paceibacterota bacterium]
MVPKVDTFARDISDEIKHKEASLADIATASNDIGNNETTLVENKSSRIFGVAITFLVVGIMGLIGFIYYYFVTMSEPSVTNQTRITTTTETPIKKATTLSSLSTTLNENIGKHVTSVTKNGAGYVITLSSYSPVFAYMTRNESDYISELLETLNSSSVQEKGKVKGATTTASSTEQNQSLTTSPSGTTSSAITAIESTPIEGGELATSSLFFWKDVTLSNVNMRVYSEGTRTVVYSFATTAKLIIAKTPEEVLTIKNAILR